ncbi:M48 family metallopeptidase [Chloroflexota bacterium]
MRKNRSDSTSREQGQVTFDQQTIHYFIRQSSRAKHIRLEIRRTTGLTVIIPRRYDIRKLPEILKEKRGWITARIAEYGENPSEDTGKPLKIGDTVPYLGKELMLVLQPGSNNDRTDIRLENNALAVPAVQAGNGLGAVLEVWYRLRAAEFIKEEARRYGSLMNIVFNRIAIRDQKTRWGSCSKKGNLNFNWRLMMAPVSVIEYVIIHELSHLKEMNHNRRFWDFVAEYCPDWRRQRKWLKDHGNKLADTIS